MYIICYVGAYSTTLYISVFFGESTESADLVMNPKDGRGMTVEIKKCQKLYLNYKFFSFLIVEILVSYPLGARAFTCYPIVTKSSGY